MEENESQLRYKHALLPYPCFYYLTILVEKPTLPPTEITPELPFEPAPILVEQLPKPIPIARPELTLILIPLLSRRVIIQLTFPLKVIIPPFSFILEIALEIKQLAHSLHFALDPITKVIASIGVDVLTLTMA